MAPDTSQVMFRHEYEHELESWLRRRFGWLCIAFFALGTAKFLWRASSLLSYSGTDVDRALVGATTVTTVEGALSLAIVAAFYFRRGRYEDRQSILHAASWMILALGAVSLCARFAVEWLGYTFLFGVIVAIFFWHLTACLFLPWTPRDSLRPILPLMTIWAIHMIFVENGTSLVTRMLSVMFSPGILVPGLMICGWRLRTHSRRFRTDMIGRHFRAMRQELGRARTIHESMFPSEYDDGFVRVQYTYKPMRELGGDFLHVNVGPEGLVHATLIDVTGHGLAAALTVNRIYGELERIRAESPKVGPGEVLTLLNRYISLTMVKHDIYASAIGMTLDPYLGEVRWASGGHPPALLRGVNGVVRHLPSTAILLGAVPDEEFEPGEQVMELAPGDILVAYTDGAIEARDRRGRQFGIDRLQDLLTRKPPPRNWPQFISASVDQHKIGRAEDDVLVTALTFSAARPQSQPLHAAMART